jgi:hypothetical protein
MIGILHNRHMCLGTNVADVVLIFGSVVLGEMDR